VLRPGIRAGCIAVLAALAACFPAEPTPFARGEEIPLASWTVAVRSVEAVSPDLLPGFDQLADRSKSRLLVVHVEIEGRDASADEEGGLPAAQRRFLKLLTSVHLKDGEGHEYAHGLPLPQSHYQMAKMGSAWSPDDVLNSNTQLGRWVVVFKVPAASRDFTLFVRNLWPAEGQARLAAVDLGR
jgi:hypothetical protein